MHLLVPPITSGLKHQEKYQDISRDRWGKWRQQQRQCTQNRSKKLSKINGISQDKPSTYSASSNPAAIYAVSNDTQSAMLFHASLVTKR